MPRRWNQCPGGRESPGLVPHRLRAAHSESVEEVTAPWGIEVTPVRRMWRPSDIGPAPWASVMLFDDSRMIYDHETTTAWLSLGALVWPRLWTGLVARPEVGEALHATIAAAPDRPRTVLRLGVVRSIREVREQPLAPVPDPWAL